jgi:hypothetical protein
MTEIQERLEIAGVLSRLDDLIREGKRHPDKLSSWSLPERRWFAELLYPIPPSKPDSRLVASDEPTPPVTIIAALLHEYSSREELRRELEKVRDLWSTLQAEKTIPRSGISEIVRVASVLRRFFLESQPSGSVTASLA